MMAVASSAAHLEYVLRMADTSLILGQRLAEWCGHGPVIEEDIALTNVALDLFGQARALLSHAAALETAGHDEDQLAFLRSEAQYRNLTIVELPNADFGCTILRNFLVTSFQAELWQELSSSGDAQLAAIAAKSLKETRYHVQHALDWTVRLGDGTEQSHLRMQNALNLLWPYCGEFFAPTPTDDEAARAGIGPAWSALRPAWEQAVRPVLDAATLQVPAAARFASHGKMGIHSEHMGHLLAQMQTLQRSHPGGRW